MKPIFTQRNYKMYYLKKYYFTKIHIHGFKDKFSREEDIAEDIHYQKYETGNLNLENM